jgi:prepilin-type N-terminal cleavage/methylation domain-containing protein
MAKNNIKSKKGFTIIEVVLVLAIAGLIFLMVFVALPALQRSQRDTQRRDDYGMLASAVTSYSASNGGKVYKLAGAANFGQNKSQSLTASKYINESGQDPERVDYILKAYTSGAWSNYNKAPKKHEVFIVLSADCEGQIDGASAPKASADQSSFAIYGYVESGSQTYCSVSHS